MITFIEFVVIFPVQQKVADEFAQRRCEDGSSHNQQKLGCFENKPFLGWFTHAVDIEILIIYHKKLSKKEKLKRKKVVHHGYLFQLAMIEAWF